MDHLFRGNNQDKGQLEQPLLGSNQGKEGSHSGMWWLRKKETSEPKEAKIQSVNDSPSESKEVKIQSINDSPSESRIDLPKLKSKLLGPTKSALKSFENISNRLEQGYPLTESAHGIIRGILERINSNDKLSKDIFYIIDIEDDIEKGIKILKNDIKNSSSNISKIKENGNNLLLVVNDSNNRDRIEKLVNLPDLSGVQKSISEDIKRKDHIQVMKHYISCIDVFTNQEYKQHLSTLREFLRTGSSDQEGSTSH
jgi:hypothetical protein